MRERERESFSFSAPFSSVIFIYCALFHCVVCRYTKQMEFIHIIQLIFMVLLPSFIYLFRSRFLVCLLLVSLSQSHSLALSLSSLPNDIFLHLLLEFLRTVEPVCSECVLFFVLRCAWNCPVVFEPCSVYYILMMFGAFWPDKSNAHALGQTNIQKDNTELCIRKNRNARFY